MRQLSVLLSERKVLFTGRASEDLGMIADKVGSQTIYLNRMTLSKPGSHAAAPINPAPIKLKYK